MKHTLGYLFSAAFLVWLVIGAISGSAMNARSPQSVRSGMLALNLYENGRLTRVSGHNFDCRVSDSSPLVRICTTAIGGYQIEVRLRFADTSQSNLVQCELRFNGGLHEFEVCRLTHSGNPEALPAMLVMDNLGLSESNLAVYRAQFPIDQIGENTIVLFGVGYVTILALLCGLVSGAWIQRAIVVRLGVVVATFLMTLTPLLFGLAYWGFSSGFVD